jgi:hypothetical protein
LCAAATSLSLKEDTGIFVNETNLENWEKKNLEQAMNVYTILFSLALEA